MESNKRLIDANALMEYINENHSYAGLPMAAHICTMELLTYAPTVDAAEVIHGNWMYCGEPDDDGNVQAQCSVCGAGDKHATCMIGNVPYCWQCGAKMSGK